MSEIIKISASDIEWSGASLYSKFILLTDIVESYGLGDDCILDKEFAVEIPQDYQSRFETQIRRSIEKGRKRLA